MQSIRTTNKLPQAYRTIKASSVNSRNMSLFYPRFVPTELAPVFRLIDDLQGVSHRRSRCGPQTNQVRSFQPRFDVKENKDSYELKGELPGIEQDNLEVAFTDEKTLKITGHTESRAKPTAAVEGQAEAASATETEVESTPVPESDTSSYHKASVEDDFEHVANPNATPAETPATETAPVTEKQEVAEPAKTERSRYWVSERSTGRFSRSFTFPSRINQEEVSASLKNGILSIVVPKAPAPENKRIEVQ